MGTHWGNEGTVKIGANAIAEIDEWEFTESVDPVDDTSMGDTYATHIANSGIKKWNGSMTCHWDEADTNGQVLMIPGASLTLNLYPEGATSGDIYWTGTASITERGHTVKKDGETEKATFTFLGNGALTRGPVA